MYSSERRLSLALQNRNQDIFIFSDSLSALQSLQSTNNNVNTNEYIFEIKKKYLDFINPYNTKLKLFWIPSHIGVKGNEAAESQAKSITTSINIDINVIPYTDLYHDCKINTFSQTTTFVKETGLIKDKIFFQSFF